MLKIFMSIMLITLSFQLYAFDTLKMMTLNTWMIPIMRKNANSRAQLIGKEIHQYDLVVLQEAFEARLRNRISQFAPKSHTPSFVPELSPQINSGLFAFSAFKIIKKSFMPFFSCGGAQCLSQKGVQHLRLKLTSGQEIDVFNTHLQAFEKDAKIRLKQLKQTKEFLSKINNGVRPLIFAGDFNVIAEIAEYDVLMTQLHGLTDVWAHANPGDPGYTWDPYTNYYAKEDPEDSVQLQRIDYIFVRNGESAEWKINRAHLTLNTPQPTFASDHFGIVAELELHSK